MFTNDGQTIARFLYLNRDDDEDNNNNNNNNNTVQEITEKIRGRTRN
jgi:hypothetical protein